MKRALRRAAELEGRIRFHHRRRRPQPLRPPPVLLGRRGRSCSAGESGGSPLNDIRPDPLTLAFRDSDTRKPEKGRGFFPLAPLGRGWPKAG